MNNNNCALKFNKYIVKTIEFKKNMKYDENKDNNSINIDIANSIRYIGENKFKVGLKITLGDKDLQNIKSPFYLLVEILGDFELIGSTENREQFAKINATSILFPYVRALITNITANANIPPLILPPMNIVNMIENNEKNKNKNKNNSEKEN